MTNYYKSKYYKQDIEVENIDGEILVNIITNSGEKIIYSWYDLEDKTSYSPYIKNALISTFVENIPKNALILGFGAGSYAKYLEDYLADINITGIEIDEAMIEVAKKELDIKTNNFFILDYIESLNILNKKKNSKFDVIFIDIYDNNSKIPESLNNIKIIELIKNIMSTDGKIIINYANYTDNKKFYNDIENKFTSLFGECNYKLLNSKNDEGNIISVYNLKDKYTSEKIILSYLSKVQNLEINYDSNLIKNLVSK